MFNRDVEMGLAARAYAEVGALPDDTPPDLMKGMIIEILAKYGIIRQEIMTYADRIKRTIEGALRITHVDDGDLGAWALWDGVRTEDVPEGLGDMMRMVKVLLVARGVIKSSWLTERIPTMHAKH